MRGHAQGISQKLVNFATSCGLKNIYMKQWLQKFIYLCTKIYSKILLGNFLYTVRYLVVCLWLFLIYKSLETREKKNHGTFYRKIHDKIAGQVSEI